MYSKRLTPALTLALGLGVSTLCAVTPASVAASSTGAATQDFLGYVRHMTPLFAPCTNGVASVNHDMVALAAGIATGNTATGSLASDGNAASLTCLNGMTTIQKLRVPASLHHFSAFSRMVLHSEQGYAAFTLGADAVARAAGDIDAHDYTHAHTLLDDGNRYFSQGSGFFKSAAADMRATAHALRISGY